MSRNIWETKARWHIGMSSASCTANGESWVQIPAKERVILTWIWISCVELETRSEFIILHTITSYKFIKTIQGGQKWYLHYLCVCVRGEMLNFFNSLWQSELVPSDKTWVLKRQKLRVPKRSKWPFKMNIEDFFLFWHSSFAAQT